MSNKKAHSKAYKAPRIDPDPLAVSGQRKEEVKAKKPEECPMGWERLGNVSWFQDQSFNSHSH